MQSNHYCHSSKLQRGEDKNAIELKNYRVAGVFSRQKKNIDRLSYERLV